MTTRYFFDGQEYDFEDFLIAQDYSQIILLADAKSNGFCIPILKQLVPHLSNQVVVVIPDGEHNKNAATCELLWLELSRLHVSKKAVLITVGGGTVSDLGAYAASVFKRGISVIHIPTTLLAMVDAAHGGKTAIDFNGIKNLLGTFHPADAIYVNPIFLQTLSERNVVAGTAEMIKHALLDTEHQWNTIQDYDVIDFSQIDSIEHSITLKNKIVAQDPFDKHIRQSLNLGHTIGHAVESVYLNTKTPYNHGEAIMIGLEAELMLSMQLFQFPEQVYIDFLQLKERLFPAVTFNQTFETLLPYLRNDKKNTNGINMSLLRDIGQVEYNVFVSENDLKNMIEELCD